MRFTTDARFRGSEASLLGYFKYGPQWLVLENCLTHSFLFKIIFQVQVLKPKDFSRILSPRRCVVIIYKIRCEVKVVKVKM